MASARSLPVGLAVCGLVATGVGYTQLNKILFTMHSVGAHDEEETFARPWFATLAMFLGMALALPLHHLRPAARKAADAARGIGGVSSSPKSQMLSGPKGFRRVVYLLVPAALDLVGTVAANVALLILPVSIWQMLKGSTVVFSALLSVPMLGKRLDPQHWLGVALSAVGVVLAGLPKVLEGGTGTGSSRVEVFGALLLLLLSQVCEALQFVWEEKLLNGAGLEPLQMVGVEGAWGATLTMVFYLVSFAMRGPCGCDTIANPYLDQLVARPTDTLLMVVRNARLCLVVLVFMFASTVYNVLMVYLIKMLSGVHCAMLAPLRMIGVWVLNLLLNYTWTPGMNDGEAWTSNSYLEVLALVLLILGQGAYAGWFAWPARCSRVPGGSAPVADEAAVAVSAALEAASVEAGLAPVDGPAPIKQGEDGADSAEGDDLRL